MSKNKEDILIVKIELKGSDIKKFNFVKEHYNLNRNAEVIRLCINDAHRIATERDRIFKNIGKPRTGSDEDSSWRAQMEETEKLQKSILKKLDTKKPLREPINDDLDEEIDQYNELL